MHHITIMGNSPDGVTEFPEWDRTAMLSDLPELIAAYETEHGKCSSFVITLVPAS